MRIAREVIETLKMELGLLKVRSHIPKMRATAESVDLSVQPRLRDHGRLAVGVGGFALRTSVSISGFTTKDGASVTVLSVLGSSQVASSLTIVDGLEVFKDATNSRTPALIRPGSVSLLKGPVGVSEVGVRTAPRIDKKPNLVSTELRLKQKSPQALSGFSPIVQRKPIGTKNSGVPSFVFSVVRQRDPFVEKEVLIEALKKMKEKYDIATLRFYGYYKDVPLSGAKMVRVTRDGTLNVTLREDVVRNGRRVSELELFDVIVFLSGEKFVYFVPKK